MILLALGTALTMTGTPVVPILAFYGLFFLLVLPLHRLGARPLALIAAGWALLGPQLLHALKPVAGGRVFLSYGQADGPVSLPCAFSETRVRRLLLTPGTGLRSGACAAPPVRLDVIAAQVVVVPGVSLPVGQEPVTAAPAPQQRGEAATGGRARDGLDDLLAVLAGVGEQDRTGVAAGVLAQQRGETVAAVLFGVAVAADTEEAEVEQAHGRCQDPLPGQSKIAQMPLDGLTHRGQGIGDIEHVLVLGLLLFGTELRVVQVLAASGASCRRPADARWPLYRSTRPARPAV